VPVEMLTYAELGERLKISPEAARALVKRHRLPRSRSNHGKTLVQIDLAEISHSPLSRGPQAQAGHQVVTDLTQKIESLQAELFAMEAIASGHRADFERECERTNKLLAELLKASSETMAAREKAALLEGKLSVLKQPWLRRLVDAVSLALPHPPTSLITQFKFDQKTWARTGRKETDAGDRVRSPGNAGRVIQARLGLRRHWRSPRFWKRPKAQGHQERTEAHAPRPDIEPRVAGEGVVDQAAGNRSRGHAETARHRGAADHGAHHLQREIFPRQHRIERHDAGIDEAKQRGDRIERGKFAHEDVGQRTERLDQQPQDQNALGAKAVAE
jgi:hypothetical protein